MLFSALFACTEPVELTTTADDSVVDVRVQEADLGSLGSDQLILEGADVTIEPGEDVMICIFGTYTGPTVGLHDVHTYQGKYGHHFQLMGTSAPALDAPDGMVVDCTGDSDSFQMVDLEPVGLTNHVTTDGKLGFEMPLPDGMAVELESGQRYVMQSHYLNSSLDTIRVRDLSVLSTIPEADVQTWAAAMAFNGDDFVIPPQESATMSFSCSPPQDLNALYLNGHMHEWGTSFRLDEVDEETINTLYDIPEWDPVYRDAPLLMNSVDDPYLLRANNDYVTTCSWFNDTDAPLEFPHEMCVTVAYVYPQKATIICDGGN